jgi:hypothetical protein
MSKVFHEKLSELTQILFYYSPYQILQTFRKMSPEDQPIDCFVAEILRQNDIALLLKKSTKIHISKCHKRNDRTFLRHRRTPIQTLCVVFSL